MKIRLAPVILLTLLLWSIFPATGRTQAGFTLEAERFVAVDTLSQAPFPMYATLTNTGDSADVFQFIMQRDMPDTSWTTVLCLKGFCLPPFVTTAVETLEVGESDTAIDISFQTVTFGFPEVEGAGYASLNVTSMRNPSLQETIHFTFISKGTDVVIVDDDGGEDYDTYYEDAVGSSYASGVWPRQYQAPTPDELSNFDVIVWETGEATPTLTEEDRQAVTGYLDGGGRLLVSGQDIGFALADPTSGEYTPATLEFYNTYFGADYLSDDAGAHSLAGISGDPISDGLDIDIQGGDGADNQTSPDAVRPRSPATVVFEYDQQNAGAVKLETGGHRVVYMAFGFEAVNSQSQRTELMSSVLGWLTGPIGIDGDETKDAPLPRTALLRQNYPNPFNPQTRIVVEIPGEKGDNVEALLAIFSLRGKQVKTLHEGGLPAGRHVFSWDGVDESGQQVSSGTYLYRLETGDRVITRKMLLFK